MSWTSEYEYAGYTFQLEGESPTRTLARDAALRFTAYHAPPLGTEPPAIGSEEEEWWVEAWGAAVTAFEETVADTLTSDVEAKTEAMVYA